MATINELDAAILHFLSLQKRYTTQHNGRQCLLTKTALEALQDARRSAEGCTFSQVDFDSETFKCSKCGCVWEYEVGNPFDNNNNFCPECGLPITEVTFVEYDDEGNRVEVTRTKEEYEALRGEKEERA